MAKQAGTPKNTHLGVRLSKETRQDLEKLAALNRRDVSEYVRIMIEDHIAEKKQSSAK